MLCLVFIYCLLVSPLCARKTGGSSQKIGGGVRYPPSHGLSGNANANYPPSNGLSGNVNANYPPSNGLSGNTYTQYPRQNYPHSTGVSGNYDTHRKKYYPSSHANHAYRYNPPQQISYGATHHPVYHGTPPIYVYEYRNSGSRYDSLLTGLALYNLGRMSAGHSHYNDHYTSNREYRGSRGEICKLRIEKNNVEYEETRIDCKLMSSFILESVDSNKVATVNSVVSTINVTQERTSDNGTIKFNNTVTTTMVQNTTIANALAVKGPSVQVTPGMQCFIIRISPSGYGTNLKKKVECGLLQEYARKSMWRNGSSRLVSNHLMLFVLMFIINIFPCLFSSYR